MKVVLPNKFVNNWFNFSMIPFRIIPKSIKNKVYKIRNITLKMIILNRNEEPHLNYFIYLLFICINVHFIAYFIANSRRILSIFAYWLFNVLIRYKVWITPSKPIVTQFVSHFIYLLSFLDLQNRNKLQFRLILKFINFHLFLITHRLFITKLHSLIALKEILLELISENHLP